MKTPLHALPLAAVTFFSIGCANNNEGDAASRASGTDGTGSNATVRAADGTTDADAARNANYSNSSASGTSQAGGKTLTPAEERITATSDMRSLRASLIADLAYVRLRLNDGTQPETQHKADRELAADLAQGLERVDRALAALDVSTDTTWASIRESQLKEVAEVRAWMNDYKSELTASK